RAAGSSPQRPANRRSVPWRELEPPRQLAAHERFEHVHPRVVRVETRQRGVTLAARGMKLFASANRELFQRFQTIRGEARCSDDEPPGAARRFLDQNPFGRGLEPFRAAEARLEGRDEPEAGPRERLLQQPRGLAAMAMIGIAE